MKKENLRLVICKHTKEEIVQEKFGDEWVCLHGDTKEDDLKLVEKFKKENTL